MTESTSTRFLPLPKDALKITDALHKEKQAVQWAGIPPEKLVQDCFIKQLNSLQLLEWLAPLHLAREYLLHDIIDILKLLLKVHNIPFNQLYRLTENFTDRYYTNVIKTLTQLLKQGLQTGKPCCLTWHRC